MIDTIIYEALAPFVIPAVMAGTQLIKSISQGSLAGRQRKDANRLLKTPKVEHKVPKRLYDNEAMYKTLASTSSRESQFLESRLDASISKTVDTTSRFGASGAGIAAATANIYGRGQTLKADALSRDEDRREQYLDKVAMSSERIANEKLAGQDWEKQLYKGKIGMGNQLSYAADQNKYQSIKGFADMIPAAMTAYKNYSNADVTGTTGGVDPTSGVMTPGNMGVDQLKIDAILETLTGEAPSGTPQEKLEQLQSLGVNIGSLK